MLKQNEPFLSGDPYFPAGLPSFVWADGFGAVRCHFPSLAHLPLTRMSSCLFQPPAAASLVFSSIHGHTATTVSSVFVFTSSPTLEPPQPPSCVPLSSIPRLQTSLLIIKHQRGAKTERPTTCMSKMNAFAKLRCQKGQHLLQTDSKSELFLIICTE